MNLPARPHKQLTADPIYRQLQRILLSACVVLAPLVILLGFVFDPEFGTPAGLGASTVAHWQADNPTLIQVFLVFMVITPYVYPVSILALGLLAMKRSPWLATLGIIIGWIGAIPFAVFVGQAALLYEIIQMPQSEALAPLSSGLNTSWPVFILHLTWVPGHLLGWLLLGIALWRVRVIPLWAAACFALNIPLTMLAYGTSQGIWQIIGTGLVLLGSIPAALAMLKRADEETLAPVNGKETSKEIPDRSGSAETTR